MTNIKSLENIEQISEHEASIVFCYEQWSSYAKEGLKIFEQLSHSLNTPDNISFWFLDLTNAPENITDWITTENKKSIKLLPAISTGNGSILWVSKGQIIDFKLSAIHQGIENLMVKTEENFQ